MEVAVNAKGKIFRIKQIEHTKCFLMKGWKLCTLLAGVISVAIEGESGDDLVVVGDGIDAACLVDTLRKKACYAMLETLEEVSPGILPPDDEQVENPQEEDDTDNSKNIEADDNGTDQTVPPHCCLAQCSTNCYEQPHSDIYEVVYDSYGPTTGCIIM